MKSCAYYGDTGAAYQGVGNGSFVFGNRCGQGGSFQIMTSNGPGNGENGQWHTISPPSISIVAAYTPLNQVLIDPNIHADGYTASFFWNGGGQTITPAGNCCGGMDYGVGINRSLPPGRYFGWDVTCQQSCTPYVSLLDVRGIDLQATDSTAPTVTARAQPNLWNQSGRWVRGVWPLGFSAADDSGVCSMSEQVGGVTLAGPSDTTPNQHSWTQCPSPQSMTSEVDTAKFANGALPLKLIAGDAAAPANVAAPAETVNLDNQPVSLSLSGPSDAPSSAGAQTVTATASAGPSGVAAVNCAVDGAAFQRYDGSSARVSVQGIGRHQVACYAQNNAIALDGSPAVSALQTFNVSIRQPTVSTLAFVGVVDRLRCSRHRERVLIPAHWTTGLVHGKPVRVRVPAERRSIRLVVCRPHVVLRRVLRGGRWQVTRTLVLPHATMRTYERIAYGARATVSGWLGTSSGVALAGQPVQIYTAADNGAKIFRLARTVLSRSNGSWTASLPPGPSRLVEAVYGGSGTTEPSFSTLSRLSVPARVKLQIQPRRTHWGRTIIISGRLEGGYVPPAGETVLLWIGWRGGSTEIGHVYARRDGSFRTRYTFLRGNGRETYWLWASSARESDYPFAPSSSRKVSLVVSQ